MTRWHWTALVAIAGLTVLALVYGLQPQDSKPHATSASVQALQRAASLEPCPSGLGPAFPSDTYDCLGGGAYVFASATGTGKPSLVNVYGSWCGPCLKEMPILRQFHAKAGAAVPLIGIDTEDDFSKGLQFAKDVGQRWPALYDNDGEIYHHFTLTGTPSTLFLNAQGKVVFVQRGAFTDLAQVRSLAQRYLGVRV